MSLKGPYRIHLAPQGYEDERISAPAIDMEADQVVLITHEEESEQSKSCRETVLSSLDDAGIQNEVEECNFFDLDDSLSTISRIITDHPNDNLKINISTGSKITAVAGVLASMMSSASPYYVKVEDYGEEPISKSVSTTIGVPAYPIQFEDEQYIRVLEFINQRSSEGNEVAIKDLNQFVQKENLPAAAESERQNEDIYDIVNREIIDPLVERDYIYKHRMANKKLLKITEKGKSTLQLSKHFV